MQAQSDNLKKLAISPAKNIPLNFSGDSTIALPFNGCDNIDHNQADEFSISKLLLR
jgi:hypothetical protein